jgi:hypothetical protein
MSKEPTHKVVVTVTSHLDDPMVHMEVSYGPLVEVPDQDAYMPAAYAFVERALLAASAQAEGEIEFEQ